MRTHCVFTVTAVKWLLVGQHDPHRIPVKRYSDYNEFSSIIKNLNLKSNYELNFLNSWACAISGLMAVLKCTNIKFALLQGSQILQPFYVLVIFKRVYIEIRGRYPKTWQTLWRSAQSTTPCGLHQVTCK